MCSCGSTRAAGNSPYPTPVVDVYNTATAAWTTAQLSQPRYSLKAETANGVAIFAGGYQNGPSGRADLYFSATGAWRTASLFTARYHLASASVRDLVLFAVPVQDFASEERRMLSARKKHGRCYVQ